MTDDELKAIKKRWRLYYDSLGGRAKVLVPFLEYDVPELFTELRLARAALGEQHAQHQVEAKALLARAEEAQALAQLAGDRAAEIEAALEQTRADAKGLLSKLKEAERAGSRLYFDEVRTNGRLHMRIHQLEVAVAKLKGQPAPRKRRA